MIRTKHLVVVVTLAIGILIGLLIAVFFGGTLDKEAISNDVSFATPDDQFGASISDEDGRENARESLIAKLESQNNNSVVKEKIAVEDNISEDEVIAIEWPTGGIPIGDGNISTSAQSGYIYSCQQNFNGGGAHASGNWIDGAYWFPDLKPSVDGAVEWPQDVNIRTAEGARVVSTNGLPNHTTGVFPISISDDAYQYDRNPNSISGQTTLLQLPQNPTLASAPSCLSLGMVGVSTNGVAIYNGLDGQGLDAAAHEIQDSCGGHPEQSGEYHYHNESTCLVDSVYEGALSTIVGYALDGFGIYSSLEDNETIRNDDLDVCHGHVHTIPWDGAAANMYHYHMTEEYPYTLGCFAGIPVEVAGASDFPPSQQGSGFGFPPPLQ